MTSNTYNTHFLSVQQHQRGRGGDVPVRGRLVASHRREGKAELAVFAAAPLLDGRGGRFH